MSSILDAIDSASTFVQKELNAFDPLGQNAGKDFSGGFILPPGYTVDGNSLPSSQVQPHKTGKAKRNIIHWFIPEFGVIRMFVNPNNMVYNYKKLISKEITKGGYNLQYWGEELTTINISGTTGSSGIEGINVLKEMYRSEQLSFDGVALSMAGSNAAAQDILQQGIDSLGSKIGGTAGSLVAGLTEGVLGLDSPNNSLAPQNVPTLAQAAFTIEMYYNGLVYRGFFDNFVITERADNFCFDYSTVFVVTQERGYRTNYFPFHRSANEGPSSDNTLHSFDKTALK